MSMRRLVIFQFLIALTSLLVLEVLARAAYTVRIPAVQITTDGFYRAIAPSAGLGWERRPSFHGRDACDKLRSFDANGLLSGDAEKLDGKGLARRRAIFLGDSNTYGYCLDSGSTFVDVAQRLVPDVAMFNLGLLGYSSLQGYKTLLKYGDLIEPDVVFISFNFNDRRYATDAKNADSDATFVAMHDRLTPSAVYNFLQYSYMFRAARHLGMKLGFNTENDQSNKLVRLDELHPRVDVQNYKANLIKIIEWARDRGRVPILILLGDSPHYTTYIRRGIAHLRRGAYTLAMQDLSVAGIGPRAAIDELARLHLSEAYRGAGDSANAEKVLIAPLRTKLDGGAPVFLDEVYNEAMREVAREYRVELIDAKSALEGNPEVYFDICHFDAAGHEIVGRLLKEALAKIEWPTRTESRLHLN